MRFEWDEHKNQRNKIKHKLSFETARLVFDDPLHISVQDRVEDGEERWQTIGMIAGLLVAVVAHTVVGEVDDDMTIRIISARKADKSERIRYEEGTH